MEKAFSVIEFLEDNNLSAGQAHRILLYASCIMGIHLLNLMKELPDGSCDAKSLMDNHTYIYEEIKELYQTLFRENI